MHKNLRTGWVLLLAGVVITALLAIPASAKVSGLEPIYADPDGTWFVNAKTMVSPSGERISFWSTVVPVKGSEYYSQLGDVLEKARKNPVRLEYVQTLLDVDCQTGRISTSNILFYDKLDRIMHTINVPVAAQQTEPAGLAADRLLVAVCGSKLAQVLED